MQIIVILPDRSVELDVRPTSTIYAIKVQIAAQFGYQTDHIILQHNGNVLDNLKTLEDHSIQDRNEIFLSLQQLSIPQSNHQTKALQSSKNNRSETGYSLDILSQRSDSGDFHIKTHHGHTSNQVHSNNARILKIYEQKSIIYEKMKSHLKQCQHEQCKVIFLNLVCNMDYTVQYNQAKMPKDIRIGYKKCWFYNDCNCCWCCPPLIGALF